MPARHITLPANMTRSFPFGCFEKDIHRLAQSPPAAALQTARRDDAITCPVLPYAHMTTASPVIADPICETA